MITLAAVFVSCGLGLIVFALARRSGQDKQDLRSLLEAELAEPQNSPEALTELMQRAGQFADRALKKTSYADKLRTQLSRAGWALRPGEFVVVLCIVAAVVGLAALLFTKSVIVSVAAGFAGVALGLKRVGSTGLKRLRKLEGQLPAVLQLLAGSLDSGASTLAAMELTAQQGDPPLSDELKRVVAETRVGRPLVDSLESMAQRVGSNDIDWTVEAIRIQNQTGGKLADTLRVLAEFMRARLEVRGEVSALSAEARFSAKVLTGMPILIGSFLFFMRRNYLEPLYTTGPGKVMLAMAIAGIAVGSLWMRQVSQVEV